MTKLSPKVNAIIRSGEQQGYVGECVEISIVTQGNTLDEVVNNLQEAILLHLEGEDPREFGLVAKPSLQIIFELQPEYA
ncbi:MAG: type II toxin-antitoxin system HicB family antitoxin [Microcystis wesenbergii TW10]|jgi:predicted RNase H-like HicB family nuclease|uniref:HicB-like antitoxin of toxin-antitoxin system domain-containing protein n=4 Tax=Microcystis TaxID=1125 RepID=A0A0A1VSG7_MICAE|nr:MULTISPECIES: type II toxin-antitoxin system HicB family antitoxin [Microcystis]REJ54141.1 MAG: type II toxin-antitoxin system HicB family antitoxin [Microcystis wesenbergii TW10]TRT85027.1 MAG: type II toxin-antitoxin system HicB family antitoxin [Microcystis aeruginosa Ma_OC_H_19870700_S124]MBD2118714.1 type II toxin-antitoxin system HicB family antitoxin [Microcystis wesenbergii FACHB-1339]MCZ8039503.1 type II toxin-antitoxin system HicB family antitoxin [Microcystis sp. LE17-20A]MCZ8214